MMGACRRHANLDRGFSGAVLRHIFWSEDDEYKRAFRWFDAPHSRAKGYLNSSAPASRAAPIGRACPSMSADAC
jgi:hypothetical protein